MKKLLFASLLTGAVVFAQAGGGSDNKPGVAAGTKKIDTTSRKSTKKKGGKKGGSVANFSWGMAQNGVQKAPAGSGGVGKVDLNKVKVGKKGTNKACKQPPAKRPESAPPGK